MQTDTDRMEVRLREWAHWLTLDGTGNGFAAVNVLHESWSPPTPGTRPTIKVGMSDRRERETNAAVVQLSARLQQTLRVHYCQRLSMAEQAVVLDVGESTVHQRIRDAKIKLCAVLNG